MTGDCYSFVSILASPGCLPKATVICCSLIKACLCVSDIYADFYGWFSALFSQGSLLPSVFRANSSLCRRRTLVRLWISVVKDSFELLTYGYLQDLRCSRAPPRPPAATLVIHQSPLSPTSFLVDVSGMSVHLKMEEAYMRASESGFLMFDVKMHML